jgi:hypothetical protein
MITYNTHTHLKSKSLDWERKCYMVGGVGMCVESGENLFFIRIGGRNEEV